MMERAMTRQDPGPSLMEHIIWSPKYTVSNPFEGYDQPVGSSIMVGSHGFIPGMGGSSAPHKQQQQHTPNPVGGKYTLITIQHMKRFLTDCNANVFDLVTAPDYATRIVQVLAAKFDLGKLSSAITVVCSGKSTINQITTLENENRDLRLELQKTIAMTSPSAMKKKLQPVATKARLLHITYDDTVKEIKEQFNQMKQTLSHDLQSLSSIIAAEAINAKQRQEKFERENQEMAESTKVLEEVQTAMQNISMEVEMRLRPIISGNQPTSETTVDWSSTISASKTYSEAKTHFMANMLNNMSIHLTNLVRDVSTMEGIQIKFRNVMQHTDELKKSLHASADNESALNSKNDMQRKVIEDLKNQISQLRISNGELRINNTELERQNHEHVARQRATEQRLLEMEKIPPSSPRLTDKRGSKRFSIQSPSPVPSSDIPESPILPQASADPKESNAKQAGEKQSASEPSSASSKSPTSNNKSATEQKKGKTKEIPAKNERTQPEAPEAPVETPAKKEPPQPPMKESPVKAPTAKVPAKLPAKGSLEKKAISPKKPVITLSLSKKPVITETVKEAEAHLAQEALTKDNRAKSDVNKGRKPVLSPRTSVKKGDQVTQTENVLTVEDVTKALEYLKTTLEKSSGEDYVEVWNRFKALSEDMFGVKEKPQAPENPMSPRSRLKHAVNDFTGRYVRLKPKEQREQYEAHQEQNQTRTSNLRNKLRELVMKQKAESKATDALASRGQSSMNQMKGHRTSIPEPALYLESMEPTNDEENNHIGNQSALFTY